MAEYLFFSLLKNPHLTGAVTASSRFLARRLAQMVQDAHYIVELGAGTGAITSELVSKYPDIPLTAIELQPTLAKNLQQKFAHIDVRQDFAQTVVDALPVSDKKGVLISSLPFLSLPKDIGDATIASILALLDRNPQTRMVQYTYGRTPPFKVVAPYNWRFISRVWRNIPPATVWELSRLKD